MTDLEQKRHEVRQRLIEQNEFPNIPAGWGVERLRFLFTESKERNGDSPVGEMLSVSEYRGVVPREYEHEEQKRTDGELSSYRVVRPGQLAVNSMWLNHLGLGVSGHTGHVSPAYNVYDISDRLDRRFVHHLMRSNYYLKIYLRYLYGIRPNSFQIKSNDWASIPIIVPDLATQRQIADFLDRETARIDLLIEKKQRLVALLRQRLNEKRSREFREIPASQVVPLRWLIHQVCDGPFGSGLTSTHYTDAGVRVVRLQNIKDGGFDSTDAAYISEEHYASLGDHDVVGGDLLVAGLGDAKNKVGRACVFPLGLGPAMVKADCFRLRLQPSKISHEFAAEYLCSDESWRQIEALAKGVTRTRLNLELVRRIRVPVPDLTKQIEVVTGLKAQATRTANLRNQIDRSIDRLKEYRSALITSAVTGQIDVQAYGKSGTVDRRLDAIQEEMEA